MIYKTKTQMSYILGDTLGTGMYILVLILFYIAFFLGMIYELGKILIAPFTKRLMK